MATQQEIADRLISVAAVLVKSNEEIKGLQAASDASLQTIENLKAVIASGGDASPAVNDAVAAVEAAARNVDERIPDTTPVA